MLKAEEAFVTLADGRQMRLETGRLAKQAAGAAVIQVGDTVILATVCFGPDKDADFFPLTVEYKEKAYSTGRFPGGYIKREGRPSEDEILTARIIDRPIRPMFPENFTREVQVVVQVLSTDRNFVPGVFGVSAASLAIGLSELPFEEQVAAVRVAVIDGKPVVNPSYAQAETSDVEMIVSGTMNSVVMVEGGAFEVDEQTLVDAVLAGHEVIKTMCKAQQELVDRCAKAKMVLVPKNSAEDIAKATELVKTVVLADLDKLLHADMVKSTLYPAVAKLQEKLLADDRVKAYIGDSDAKKAEIKMVYGDLERTEMRNMILNEGRRIDGRKTTDIRHIEIQTQVLPSVHGSTVFQRGETQALVTCTLGTKADEQRIETLQGDASKNYMLHYNFPPFSVGEVKRMGTVGRREIGHGHLAERSLSPVLPHPEDFPYTIRIVSEILESNGSSSMASVCGGSLALMDAGVPIKSPVAGIAMGLISGNGKVEILSDITGTEDHLGDMDFKVTGTKDGITAFQMDIKIKGITAELMGKAMSQARAGRLHILGKMAELGLANPPHSCPLGETRTRDQGPGTKGPRDQGPGTKGPGTKGPGTKGPRDQGPGTKPSPPSEERAGVRRPLLWTSPISSSPHPSPTCSCSPAADRRTAPANSSWATASTPSWPRPGPTTTASSWTASPSSPRTTPPPWLRRWTGSSSSCGTPSAAPKSYAGHWRCSTNARPGFWAWSITGPTPMPSRTTTTNTPPTTAPRSAREQNQENYEISCLSMTNKLL